MSQEPSVLEQIFDFVEHNWKVFKRLLVFMAVCFALILGFRFIFTATKRFVLTHQTKVTIEQIASLVSNIRTISIQNQHSENIKQHLIASGALPRKMLKDGRMQNVVGGNIEISYSQFADTVNPYVKVPTFVISYQGLSKKLCKELASLNWNGGESSGLISIAVGEVDERGTDTAMRDIEADYNGSRRSVVYDENGKTHVVSKIPYQMITVAKPDDSFVPIPFPEDLADKGCSCGLKNTCSFAVRYAVYETEKR